MARMPSPRRFAALVVAGALALAACASGNPVSRSATRVTSAGTVADPDATGQPAPAPSGSAATGDDGGAAGPTAAGSTPATSSGSGGTTSATLPGAQPDTTPETSGGGAATTPNSEPGTRPDDPTQARFGWRDDGAGLARGSLEVPLDYADPSKGTITLAVERHLATDPAHRIGTLLVNPGGPGAPGTVLANEASFVYDSDLLARFDIIGWDPRGTGASTPAVNCTDDYDHYFGLDSSPDTAAERQALIDAGTQFGAACEQRDPKLLPYVDTVSSARDIDSIRAALGEGKISYFGFSYGSELGATWATLYPTTVRAAVLDGAVDPTVGYLQQNLEQAAGFEATFDTFLAQCSAQVTCTFYNGGHADTAYDALAQSIEAKPLAVDPTRTPVTEGVLETAVNVSLYSESSWPQLAQALADAQRGDGNGLLKLYDQYFNIDESGGRSDDNSTEAYFAIQCLDHPGSTGPADLYSHEAEFAAAAPRLGRGWMAELTFCSVWPVPAVPAFTVTGKGAGPIVVVGTTGDPATPLASSKKMAAALEDGRLVVVQANQHTGYRVNSCVDQAVDGYLVDPTQPPANGLSCL
jgi:pimeloyl-ACP methyl ester carboxylesterase